MLCINTQASADMRVWMEGLEPHQVRSCLITQAYASGCGLRVSDVALLRCLLAQSSLIGDPVVARRSSARTESPEVHAIGRSRSIARSVVSIWFFSRQTTCI